jgi:hypothetical protein
MKAVDVNTSKPTKQLRTPSRRLVAREVEAVVALSQLYRYNKTNKTGDETTQILVDGVLVNDALIDKVKVDALIDKVKVDALIDKVKVDKTGVCTTENLKVDHTVEPQYDQLQFYMEDVNTDLIEPIRWGGDVIIRNL